MELDGTIVGKFGRAGKAAGEFATIHQMDCRDPERDLHRRDQQLALAEDPAEAAGHEDDEPAVGGGIDEHARIIGARRHAGASALSAARSSRNRRAGDRVRLDVDLLKTPERRLRRRSRRRRRQFEGPDLRLHAHRPSVRDARRQPHVLARRLAAVQFDRSGKFVRELGPGRLRLQRRDRPARRSAGQRLDHRRGANQVVKFDAEGRVALVLGRKPEAIARAAERAAAPARPARLRAPVRAPVAAAAGGGGGGLGGGQARTRAGLGHAGLDASAVRPTWPGTRPATSTSPTASAPTTASRSSTRTAASSRTGARPAPGPGQFTGVKAIADRRAGRRLRRRRRQQAHPGVRRRGQVQVGVRQRRHAADDVHDARRDAVPLHLARRRRRRHGRRRHLQGRRSTARWSASSARPASC